MDKHASSENGKCLACDNDNILSSNKMKCFPVIVGCMIYSSSHSKCKSCIHGTQISSDKLSCYKNKDFREIIGCIEYDSDSKCKFCKSGQKLSSNKFYCFEI